MEKKLRSNLQSSPQHFLSSATKLSLKSSKSTLKALIHSIAPSSSLSSSLPPALLHSISLSIQSFQNILENPPKSPKSPPTKRLRRSSRNSNESNPNEGKQEILENLQILAHIAFLCVSHPKKGFLAEDLLPGVRQLHDYLILFESDSVLLSEIANLCEAWWKENLPSRESLISQSLPFLISRSLTLKKKVDVHRVYSLREAFSLFDFEDQSIEDLKLLLIRCIITPLYLKTEDGKKFLAFMFGLSNQLAKEAFAMIRSQIRFGRKSMLEAYGDITFRAWKAAEGELRNEIESGFLQGLIEGAIHARLGAFGASIRRILGGFINQRTVDGVEKVLFRLAEPVIFRSLQVANSNVRQNALHLLLDMFPLEDPDSTKEAKDTLLDKQFFLLEKLLMDDCPDVRVIAVEGSCRILRLFWEIIPSSTITKIITKVFDDMSHDICNEVRLSTLNGIIYLLGNPHSHEILKVLLPRVGHLMLDNVLSVRTAVADLLLLLRDIRTFQFNKVVGLEVLLSTLADDQSQVAQKITRLLIPSYFPSKVTLEEACNRCVTLIKRSPMAGARFCEFSVSEGASLKSLLELVRVFISLVLSPDKLDANQIDGLLVATAYLCRNLESEPVYKNALKELLTSEKVKILFTAACGERAQTSVLNIVSTLSLDDVGGLFEECMGVVTNCSGLSENEERQAEVRSATRLLISCNQFDDMFVAVTRLLEKTAYRCHIKFGTKVPKQRVSSAKRKKPKSSVKSSAKWKYVIGKKSSSFEEDYLIAVGIAWQIKELLISEDTRKAILESQTLELAFLALKDISEVSIVQCMHCEYMDTFPVLAYATLAMHMTSQNVGMSSANKYNTTKNHSKDSPGSVVETVSDQAMEHLINCTEKLFASGDSGKSSKLPSESKHDSNKRSQRRGKKQRESQTEASCSSDGGPIYSQQKRILNGVKMLTAVLKLVVDACTTGLVSHNWSRCLKFASAYVQFIISTLGQQSSDQALFKEELNEVIVCLKSSFTYAAKLLNLVLADTSEDSPPPPESFDLANNLFDLVTSVELYLGSSSAERFVGAAKAWLPDMILALGSGHILEQTHGERSFLTAFDRIKLHFPSWLYILAKTELCEASKDSPEEEDDRVPEEENFPAFKKQMGTIASTLRGNGNSKIMDAVGVVFLAGSIVGMQRKDFGLVLGLLQFVCLKLLQDEDREWSELDMMLASLQDIYPQIEREIEEQSDEDGRQKLHSARALLEPIWMYHVYETGRFSMMEE